MSKLMIASFDGDGMMHRVATVYRDDQHNPVLVLVHYPSARICNEDSVRENPLNVQNETW